MKTLIKLIVPLLLGTLVACGGDPNAGPVTVSPKSVTVKAGDKTTLTATVQDAEESRVLWSVEGGDTNGTVTSSGVYTAPAAAGTYTVVATNAFDSTKTDKSTITVTPVVLITVKPGSSTVDQGEAVELSASVAGTTNTAVTWSVEGGSANGTVTSAGIYTAPATAGTYTVVATSAADAEKKGSTTITVRPVAVTVTPSQQSVSTAGSVALYASVSGTRGDSTVTWSVEGGDANGTISSSGVYTAPTAGGTYTVTATSVADPAKKGTIQVTVVPVVVKANSETLSLDQGATAALSAEVTGTSSTAVTWAVEGGGANGSVTSSGVYTAPNRDGTYTVTATSVADPSKKATTVVTVNPVAVAVTPGDQATYTTGSVSFSALVSGTTGSKSVTWSVQGGDTKGTITSAGVYTAPTAGGTYTVVATSVTDPAKKATAQVTVTAVGVKVNATDTTVDQGATTTLSAEVTGAPSAAVTWSASDGSISADGVFQAPDRKGTVTVTATSVTDPSKKATASISVRDVQLSITPATLTLTARASNPFTATVTGTVNKAVTWSVGGGDSRGTVTSAGVYTAPAAAGRFTVVATSVADPRKTVSATVTVPAATGISYADPTGTGWKLVKNTGMSTATRLVLDLVAPAGEKSHGVDLNLSADAPRATWAKLAGGDSEYALNLAYDLGSGPQLFKSTARDNDLFVGVFQKGATAPAAEAAGAVLTVALDLRTGPTLPSGAVRLAVTKAHALSESGTLAPIDVAVGTLTAQ